MWNFMRMCYGAAVIVLLTFIALELLVIDGKMSEVRSFIAAVKNR